MNWRLLNHSLLVSDLAALLAVGLGLLAAVWIAGLPERVQPIMLALAAIALALPPFVVLNGWIALLGQNGWLRPWLPLDLYSFGGAVGVLAVLLWPIPLFAILAAWRKVDTTQFESEPRLKGARLMRWLLLPAAQPALDQAAFITFVLALGNFAVPALLQVPVLPAEVWVRFNTNFDFRGALSLSLPLLLAPAALLGWLRRQPIVWPRHSGAFSARVFRKCLGRVWWCAAGLGGVLLLTLAVGLPIGELVFSTRTWTEFGSAFAASGQATWASAAVAGTTATLTTALGLLAARWRVAGIAWLSFLLPGVFLGIGLIWALNRPPWVALYQSAGVVLLALGLRYLAVGRQGAVIARAGLDPDLDAAARLSGANAWQRFRWVGLPQMAPSLAAGWYVVYLLCLWDVETLVLIVPPGGETLALRIFNLLHYGHNAQVNALSLILLGLAVLPLAIWWLGRGIRRSLRPASLAAAVVIALTHCGCSPGSGSEGRLESRFFARVEIIGTRGAGPGQFNKPRSVAIDSQDNLYVTDLTGRVQKFSPQGEYLLSWQMPQTDLGKPKGMGLDHHGRIIVIEPHYSRVNHFDTSGHLLRQWGQHGTNAGQLAFPRAVALAANGDLWVSEYGATERVQRFAQDGERLVAVLSGFGERPGQFNRAEGLGIDDQDRLYVADSCNHRIQVFSSEGRWLRCHGHAGTGPGELSYPYDVRVDAQGHQFVCEFGNSRIQVFDSQDRPVEVVGGPGTAPGHFNNPWSIALDSHGNLYVADANNHRVQKFVRRPPAQGAAAALPRRPKQARGDAPAGQARAVGRVGNSNS